jgi:hypothetical protein
MKHRKQNSDRKSLQLCSQVRWALEYEINESLDSHEAVTVFAVLPAPNTSNLLVVLETLEKLSWEQAACIERKMALRANALRAIVAHSIQRRKTPSLTFCVRPKSLTNEVSPEGNP